MKTLRTGSIVLGILLVVIVTMLSVLLYKSNETLAQSVAQVAHLSTEVTTLGGVVNSKNQELAKLEIVAKDLAIQIAAEEARAKLLETNNADLRREVVDLIKMRDNFYAQATQPSPRSSAEATVEKAEKAKLAFCDEEWRKIHQNGRTLNDAERKACNK